SRYPPHRTRTPPASQDGPVANLQDDPEGQFPKVHDSHKICTATHNPGRTPGHRNLHAGSTRATPERNLLPRPDSTRGRKRTERSTLPRHTGGQPQRHRDHLLILPQDPASRDTPTEERPLPPTRPQ